MAHLLVPKHEKLSDGEIAELFKKYSLRFIDLPKISAKDKGMKDLEVQEGDVIKITRNSLTAGITVFYRGVIND